MENFDPNVYGYVNGESVYSRNEYIFKRRGFEEIKTDEELMKYSEEVTSHWYYSGWHHKFIDYYLGNYALDHPKCDLTDKEYIRLKELQKIAKKKHEEEEAAKEWKLVRTECWADNSEEEVWINKFGETKRIMIVAPHGDAC